MREVLSGKKSGKAAGTESRNFSEYLAIKSEAKPAVILHKRKEYRRLVNNRK